MPNILLTNYCNRSCSYCFARQKLKDAPWDTSKKANLSLENLQKIIDFLRKPAELSLPFLGGEPTLHPDFIEICESAFRQGCSIKMFTNGMISREKLEYISRQNPNKFKIIMNINHPDETPESELKKIEATLDSIGKFIAPGFNIHKLDFDMDFLLDLNAKYNLRKVIRVGIAQPILGTENAFIPLEDYPVIGEKLIKFFEETEKLDIRISFDCGFVLCMFTEKQLGRLYYLNAPFKSVCNPILDIGPDLNVWHCFPLSGSFDVAMSDFDNRQEIYDYFENKFRIYKNIGAMDKCLECKYLRRGQCSGGCLAHTIRAFNKR